MLTNILVTLDGSPCSEAVLPVVADLALASRAQVTLFIVGEPPGATLETPLRAEPTVPRVAPGRTLVAPPVHYAETREQAIERRERELREYLKARGQRLRERGIQVNLSVVLGESAADHIIGFARSKPVDLIAMATHGHTGLRSVIFGSVAGKVVGSGVRPVLLVRPRDLGPRE